MIFNAHLFSGERRLQQYGLAGQSESGAIAGAHYAIL